MEAKKTVVGNFSEHLRAMQDCVTDKGLFDSISLAASKTVDSLKRGGKILVCGNGGSAADANHIAAEFINKYRKDRKPLPAISLSANPSNLTSIANDYSFDLVFSKQVEALGNRGDVFMAISTSGKSRNIIAALKKAKEKRIYSILITGSAKTEASKLANLVIAVPSASTPRIQEAHLIIYHCICEIVESGVLGNSKGEKDAAVPSTERKPR